MPIFKRVVASCVNILQNSQPPSFQPFRIAGDLVVNDEDEEESDFETLDIENSNENDESEINE